MTALEARFSILERLDLRERVNDSDSIFLSRSQLKLGHA